MSSSIVYHRARATLLTAVLITVLSAPTARAAADAPSREIVEQVLKSTWDKPASSMNAKSTLTLNSVKFGKPYKATKQEVQVEGFPEGATVTPAIVDFTVRTYYARETQAVHRVREARVYKDKMDDWAVMTGAVKGQDSTTKDDAQK
jgi:hypothetical protein